MQHYKSLSTAGMICATLVNIQTHTQTERHTDRQHFHQLLRIAQPAELKKEPEDKLAVVKKKINPQKPRPKTKPKGPGSPVRTAHMFDHNCGIQYSIEQL